MTPTELHRLNEFVKQHTKHNSRNHNCNKFSIEIDTSSGIGVHVKIRCDSCEKEKDITEFEKW
jgi:hypothetical protein